MDLASIFTNSLWAALFAVGLGVRLTAPLQYLIPTFLGGFAGRLVHSLLVQGGMGRDWATVLAAAAIVAVAVATTHRHRVSPIVLICAVLPLGAAGACVRCSSCSRPPPPKAKPSTPPRWPGSPTPAGHSPERWPSLSASAWA